MDPYIVTAGSWTLDSLVLPVAIHKGVSRRVQTLQDVKHQGAAVPDGSL